MWQKTASSEHTPTQNSSRLRVVAVCSSSRCSFFSVSAAERLAFHQMPRRFRQIADKINNGRPADVDSRFADHCRHTERTERRRPGERVQIRPPAPVSDQSVTGGDRPPARLPWPSRLPPGFRSTSSGARSPRRYLRRPMKDSRGAARTGLVRRW